MLTLGNKSLPVKALVLPHLSPDEMLTDNITMKVFEAKLGKRLDDFLLNKVISPSLQFISENLSDQDPFNDWGGGGGDVTNLSPFWEKTARK